MPILAFTIPLPSLIVIRSSRLSPVILMNRMAERRKEVCCRLILTRYFVLSCGFTLTEMTLALVEPVMVSTLPLRSAEWQIRLSRNSNRTPCTAMLGWSDLPIASHSSGRESIIHLSWGNLTLHVPFWRIHSENVPQSQ